MFRAAEMVQALNPCTAS